MTGRWYHTQFLCWQSYMPIPWIFPQVHLFLRPNGFEHVCIYLTNRLKFAVILSVIDTACARSVLGLSEKAHIFYWIVDGGKCTTSTFVSYPFLFYAKIIYLSNGNFLLKISLKEYFSWFTNFLVLSSSGENLLRILFFMSATLLKYWLIWTVGSLCIIGL